MCAATLASVRSKAHKGTPVRFLTTKAPVMLVLMALGVLDVNFAGDRV